MASEKLIAFILKARQNKRNDDQILQQLLSVGWKQEAITDAFSEIKSHKLAAPTAAQAAKTAQAQAAQQPAQAAPPWVKPATATAPMQPAATTTQPLAQASPQPSAAPASSAPQQPSTAPIEAAQTAQMPSTAPAQQAPAASQPPQLQTPPVIATPQPAPQSPIPPANQIQLPPQKKSLFSSLFGKKPQQPPMASAQPAAPPQQMPAQPAARPPVFPPRAPTQTTIQPPATSPSPVVQGQSTLATFAGATSQQSATVVAPATTAPVLQPPPITPPAVQMPSASPPQQQPAAQAKPSAGIMKLLPIITFVIILAAAGAYYVLVMAPASNAPPVPSQPLNPPVQNATPSNPIQQASGPKDCGADMDCFIQASGTCAPAKMVRNTSVDFFGMILSGSTYMEIQNTSGAGKCSLYSLTLDSSVKLSDAMVAAALAKGTSIDDIKKQEAESSAQAKAVVGMNGTCKFNTDSLSALLAKWKSGSSSSDDFAGADCRGKLYESSSSQSGSYSLNSTAKGANGTNYTVKTSYNYTFNSSYNVSKGNSSAPTGKANSTNKTSANSSSTSKTNTSTTAPKANTSSAANASSAATFKYSNRYTTYYPEKLVWFCEDRKTGFYRMHWKEYFGGGCSVEKPKDGYVNLTEYEATGCTILPCCINGPYNEYSRSYDYFECGYN